MYQCRSFGSHNAQSIPFALFPVGFAGESCALLLVFFPISRYPWLLVLIQISLLPRT